MFLIVERIRRRLKRPLLRLFLKARIPELLNIFVCNVVIKLVTKSIANRIKLLLPDIIDNEQSAFVKGRLIIDNALIAMECFHWLKKKSKGRKGVMAMKLDM